MPHPVAIAEGRVLPGIRPAVLGTLSIVKSIELVVVVCAVRVVMACGPGARQPPSSAWVILRAGARPVSTRGLEFRDMTDWNSAAAGVYRTRRMKALRAALRAGRYAPVPTCRSHF